MEGLAVKQEGALKVVFDGHCAICRATMTKLLKQFGDRLDPVDFRLIPPQEIHPSLNEERCHAQMHVIKDGQVFGGAEAVVKILQLSPIYRCGVWLYYVPPLGWIAERAYAWVSRNRFRLSKWFGGKVPECTDACTIHSQNGRAKKK
jgi:predicted DCC family thiol-disulfide oxidoreductase YuxK